MVPSRKEAFGLVAIEALACGTPVIATNQGGIPDFLKKEVGILIDVDNSNMLAQAIMKILNKKIFDSNYIANYAKDNYSQIILIDQLIDTYELCL